MQNIDMEWFGSIKNFLITTFSVVMAYFAPIQDMVFTIFFLFLVNCFVGMVTGMMRQHETFSLKKFGKCISETLSFYLIVVCLFVVGKNMNNMEGAMQAIGGVIYSILYFYSVNVLRNLTKVFPDSNVLLFLYYIVSFEFVKKFTYLQGFRDYLKNKHNENEKN
ncbi:MAG: hypothetical protein IKR18_11585 [Bacteroidaceae bacterium]|nr:hypothetical protein [Bacteroidaceae bacterium]